MRRIDALLVEARELAEADDRDSLADAAWDAILERLGTLFADDAEADAFASAVEEGDGDPSKPRPLALEWLVDLVQGASRLPPELTARQFAPLLTALIDPPASADPSLTCICTRCGLARPAARLGGLAELRPDPTWDGRDPAGRYLKMPAPLPACPCCGEREWAWSTVSGRQPQPWWDLSGTMPRDE